MPGNKNHHYVPQALLKNFSVRGERKQIGLYNHQTNLFVAEASIRHQASKDYLYGKDTGVESALSILEAEGAKIINTMRETFVPPSVNDNAYKVFKRYMITQMYRTLHAGREMEESLNRAFQAIWSFQPKYKEEYADLRIKHQYPEVEMLGRAQEYVPLLDYLDCKLLVNLSELPFIISDNPVVTYNRLMQLKDNYMGATAIAAKGLQIFFPVFDRMMVCLYDPKMYHYNGEDEFRIVTESIGDVHQLNALQYLTSESQLFFNELVPKEYIRALVNQFKPNREGKGPFSRRIVDKTGSKSRYFLLNSSIDPTIDLQLSFVTLTKEAVQYIPDGASFLRHPSFQDIKETIRKNTESMEEEQE